MRRLITLTILAALLSLAGSAAAQITILNHATVIDGTGAAPQNDVAILMENGRIRDMGPSSKIHPQPALTSLTSQANSLYRESSMPTAMLTRSGSPSCANMPCMA